MTFNSYVFILLFLPLFVLLYFLAGRINSYASKIVIIFGGIVFYTYAGWKISVILGLSIVVNYLISCVLRMTKHKKTCCAITILFNIGLLLYFKYFNFTIDIINSLGKTSFPHRELILPLGISFFTFQQIMYVISEGRGELQSNIIDYLAYILYFPKLVMGPLMSPIDFLEQLNDTTRKKVDWGNVACGIRIFSYGLFKKILLADTFQKAVTWGFANGVTTIATASTATAGDLFLVMISYTFQIYFDFSGYSDMAVGISKMINIDLPINFDSPYKATSIRDFWKRWHISLTKFLTAYVYFPLGGSRKGKVRTYINIMMVFIVSGIWHGANWTFVLWGCLHGILQVVERLLQKWFDKLFAVVKWGYTFFSVNILWLLFRSDSIEHWYEMLQTMFRFQNMSISEELIKAFELPESTFIYEKLNLASINASVRGFSMLIFFVSAFLICLVPKNNYKSLDKTNLFNMMVSAVAFVWSFLCLSSESVFVYFNF